MGQESIRFFFRCLEGQSGLNHASKLELSWFPYIKLSSNLINIIVPYNPRSRLYNDCIVISYANNSAEKNRIEIKKRPENSRFCKRGKWKFWPAPTETQYQSDPPWIITHRIQELFFKQVNMNAMYLAFSDVKPGD